MMRMPRALNFLLDRGDVRRRSGRSAAKFTGVVESVDRQDDDFRAIRDGAVDPRQFGLCGLAINAGIYHMHLGASRPQDIFQHRRPHLAFGDVAVGRTVPEHHDLGRSAPRRGENDTDKGG